MKNKLSDLNNHLFAQIERLGDEDLTAEQIGQEVERGDLRPKTHIFPQHTLERVSRTGTKDRADQREKTVHVAPDISTRTNSARLLPSFKPFPACRGVSA